MNNFIRKYCSNENNAINAYDGSNLLLNYYKCDNMSLNNNNLIQTIANNDASCLDKCNSIPDCKVAIFNSSNNDCSLKNKFSINDVFKNDNTSLLMNNSNNYIENNYAISSNMSSNLSNIPFYDTLNNCKNKCDNDINCIGFNRLKKSSDYSISPCVFKKNADNVEYNSDWNSHVNSKYNFLRNYDIDDNYYNIYKNNLSHKNNAHNNYYNIYKNNLLHKNNAYNNYHNIYKNNLLHKNNAYDNYHNIYKNSHLLHKNNDNNKNHNNIFKSKNPWNQQKKS
jgi:hypothetical protein